MKTNKKEALIFVIVAIICMTFAVGYSDGRADKAKEKSTKETIVKK